MDITTKQQKILLHLYRFRFLNRYQIQILLNHKNPNRTNSWLKELTDKKYVGRILNKESKINSVPAKYYLLKKSIAYLKSNKKCDKQYLIKFYRENKRSDAFINLSMFIADIYLYLSRKYKEEKGFIFYSQTGFSPKSIIKEIFPHFVYRREKEGPFYIVEYFNNRIPYGAIRARVERYFSNSYFKNNSKTLKFLFISTSASKMDLIKKCINRFINEESLDFEVYLTTLEKIKNEGFEGKIWQNAVS